MKKVITILLLTLMMIGCASTKVIEVPVETIKTEYRNQYIHDSIYVKDSVDRYRENDTVFINKWHTKYIYQLKTDTVLRTDSIPYMVEVPIVQEVNKLKWYQETLIWIGGIVLLILLIYLCIKLVKFIIKLYVK